MFTPSELKVVDASLSRIAGQVRGIQRMVDERRTCVEIIQQVRATESALRRVRLAVVRSFIDTELTNRLNTDGPERDEAERQIQAMLLRMVGTSQDRASGKDDDEDAETTDLVQ